MANDFDTLQRRTNTCSGIAALSADVNRSASIVASDADERMPRALSIDFLFRSEESQRDE